MATVRKLDSRFSAIRREAFRKAEPAMLTECGLDEQLEKGEFFTTKQWNWQGESDNILLQYLDGMNMAWIEYSKQYDDLAL
jgi:hypothetical protein